MSGARSLHPDESRRLQTALRALVAEKGSQTAVATSLGVTQQGISSILAGTSPGSYAMARQVARVMGLSVEAFLAGELAPPPPTSPWRQLPGFAAAVAQARALFPRTSAEAWEWVGQLSGPPLPELTPGALALIAAAYDQSHPGTPRAARGHRARPRRVLAPRRRPARRLRARPGRAMRLRRRQARRADVPCGPDL